MNAHHSARPVLASAVALGVLGDQLLRAPDELWGLNVALGLTTTAGFAFLFHLTATDERSPARRWAWVAAAFFASMWVVRDAEMLLAMNLLAALSLACLPLIEPRGAALRTVGVLEWIAAPLRAAWHGVSGAVGLAATVRPPRVAPAAAGRAKALATGLLLAALPVLVFGSLFVSADPIFGAAVRNVLRVDLGPLLSHVAVATVLAWIGGGYLWAQAASPPSARVPIPQARLGALQIATALGATVLVFLAFVAVQAGSLFGGEAFVQNRAGLTYAEYARRGFFQMLFAAALSLPLVYVAPFAAGTARGDRGDISLRALMTVQLALTSLVLASALWRMALYVRAYGLTEDRLYGTAVMIWVGATIGVFGFTVLRDRPAGAPFGGTVAAVVVLAGLNLANPARIIARYNLSHPGARGVDVTHLGRLGADAAPELAQRLDALGQEQRCALANQLVKRHGESRGDWRGWNLARARARRAAQRLETLAGSCPQGPDDSDTRVAR